MAKAQLEVVLVDQGDSVPGVTAPEEGGSPRPGQMPGPGDKLAGPPAPPKDGSGSPESPVKGPKAKRDDSPIDAAGPLRKAAEQVADALSAGPLVRNAMNLADAFNAAYQKVMDAANKLPQPTPQPGPSPAPAGLPDGPPSGGPPVSPSPSMPVLPPPKIVPPPAVGPPKVPMPTGPAAGASGAAAAATMARLAAVAGPLAAGFTLLAGTVTAGAAAMKIAFDRLHADAQRLTPFSGPLSLAEAQNELRRELMLLRRADRVGPDLARVESLRGRGQLAVERINGEILATLSRFVLRAEPAIDRGIDLLNRVADVAEKNSDQIDAGVLALIRNLHPLLGIAVESSTQVGILQQLLGIEQERRVNEDGEDAFMDEFLSTNTFDIPGEAPAPSGPGRRMLPRSMPGGSAPAAPGFGV